MHQVLTSSARITACLVCRKLHLAVLPQLYDTVELDITIATPGDAVTKMLSSQNPGLEYIRNLKLVVGNPNAATPYSEYMFSLLVSILPRHILRTIR